MQLGKIAGVSLAVVLGIWDAQAAETAPARCRYVKVATLPLSLAGALPSIPGMINGKAAAMLLNTGAAQTVLTRAAVEKFGLKVGPSPRSIVGTAGESSVHTTWLDGISIGPIRREGMKAPVAWDSVGPFPHDALVGADFLFQRDLELSIAEGEARFFHPVGCEDAFLAYWDRNASVVPLVAASRTDTRAVVTVSVNGQKVRAMISTGSPRTVLALSAAARAGVRPGSAGVVHMGSSGGIGKHPVEMWAATFESFTIGGETIGNARIAIMDIWGAIEKDLASPMTSEWIREQPEMILGADFLRAHRVLFALSQRRFYFSHLGGRVFSVDQEAGAAK